LFLSLIISVKKIKPTILRSVSPFAPCRPGDHFTDGSSKHPTNPASLMKHYKYILRRIVLVVKMTLIHITSHILLLIANYNCIFSWYEELFTAIQSLRYSLTLGIKTQFQDFFKLSKSLLSCLFDIRMRTAYNRSRAYLRP